MHSGLHVGSSRQSFFQRSLSALTGLAITVAMAIAADYGIGPVQAGTLDAATTPPASSDQAIVVSTLSIPLSVQATAQLMSPAQVNSELLAASPDIAHVQSGATQSDTSPRSVPVRGSDPGRGRIRLPGHVLDAIDSATPLPAGDARIDVKQPLTLTVVQKRDDQSGFDRYLHDLYDPSSPLYRHFLTQTEIADRFGPFKSSYEKIERYLQGAGFRILERSKNRMTLTVRASRAHVERAFDVAMSDFEMRGMRFHANRNDPAVAAQLAPRFQSIIGLNNLARPQSVIKPVIDNLRDCSLNKNYTQDLQVACAATYGLDLALYDIVCMLSNLEIGTYEYLLGTTAGVVATTFGSVQTPSAKFSFCNFELPYQPTSPSPTGRSSSEQRGAARVQRALTAPRAASPPAGQGQKIGLVEFDSFNTSDVSNLLAYLGLPATEISQLQDVKLEGSPAVGAGEDEVLLDIAIALTTASNATTVVYEAPLSGAGSFQSVFNRMINDGMTVISNSWAYCEDQTTLADVQSIDAVLQNAAAAGISVFSGSGDTGNTCLDGSTGVIAVPADSPNVTAVGGTSLNPGPNGFGSETWWNGSATVPTTGQGGYGTSKFFARPSYQNGFTSSSQRSIPDVVSAADPLADGLPICQADNGGCPNGLLYGGTSASTPFWASLMALFNAVGGKDLGLMNPYLYQFAATSDFSGFHPAASMGSDFAHVGLGSPDASALYMAFAGATTGVAAMSSSSIGGTPSQPPADGTTPVNVIVTLRDANSFSLAGKSVSLTANSGSHVTITARNTATTTAGVAGFTITDTVAETVNFTAIDSTDGVTLPNTLAIAFQAAPAASAGISATPSTVAADGQSAATVIVTLKDSLNRPTPGKTVTVSNNGSHAVLTGPTPGVTDANGQIQFAATDQVNETVTFTATDVTDADLAVPGSATVTYSNSTSTACSVGVTPVAASGYTITAYVTGLPAAANLYYGGANIGCPGANSPAFTPGGVVLVSDFLTGAIYQTGLSGGGVSSSNILSTVSPALGNLVYGKDGNVYATQGDSGGEIVQIDPTTGAVARVVVSGLTCPAGLSVDPLSGDLFFDDQCTGGGFDDATIYRVIDPPNSDSTKPTTKVAYATTAQTPNGGMSFAPNGTLYVVSGYYNNQTPLVQAISATSSATVTVTTITGASSDYAVRVGVVNADGSANTLIVEPAGVLSEVPIANPSAATVIASVSPGVGVAGPDGCLYSALYNTVWRLANSTGDCTFAPTSPAPSIALGSASSATLTQGATQTLTAVLHNTATLAGVPVSFQIGGINTQVKVASTDATGTASVKYTGLYTGTDTVIATATVSSTALQSNTAHVTWNAGAHVSFVSLNAGPGGGSIGAPVTVTAQLSDASVVPGVALAGQSITFTLGSTTCTAVTGQTGTASCQITPAQVGAAVLTARFAGNSKNAAASGSSNFTVLAAPASPPTVSLTVSPTTVAAGTPATLKWSSTNATACAASGAWSGTEATSGTQSVTASATGSYTYTLTCSGNGGSIAASATLSATLVPVTVTAKSGGGALSWYLVLALGLLVMVRLGATMAGGAVTRGRGNGGTRSGLVLWTMLFALAAVHPARADQSSLASGPAASPDQPAWLDPYYVGIRAGSMPVREDSGKIDQGLAALGFGAVTARTDTSGTAGTVFVGYEFTPHTAVELGYTHRDSNTAYLSGTIASTAKLTPLLQGTTELIRGYGNIVSLSYSGRFEVLPRFSLEPRLGGFFWATKVSAVGFDDRIDVTHEGGGVTAGLTAAYRIWRGLELGVNVDHFRGFPNNIATLYGGSLEWRFGP
jgi:hypothetical protein